jgi:hypothetical protein
VPLENSDRGGSRVEFFNVKDPTSPEYVDAGISRPGVLGGVVALTRLDDGRFVAAVWSDSEPVKPSKHLDLYVSEADSLLSGSWDGPFCYTDEVEDIPQFQTVSLTWSGKGTKKKLYALGYENTAKVSPNPNGINRAVLYEVLLPGSVVGRRKNFQLKEVVPPKVLVCAASFADMDAASGTYIDPNGRLSVYCGHHFLRLAAGNRYLMRFQEFVEPAAPGVAGAPMLLVDESVVEFYSDIDFKGSQHLAHGAREARIDDLDHTMAGSGVAAERVSSLRCTLPEGFVLMLYTETDQKGSSPLAVPGNGSTIEIPDLAAYQFGDKARSCAIVAVRVANNKDDARWIPT